MERKLLFTLVAISGLFVLASGGIHLREWLDTYRNIPSQVDGAFVVTIGFPLHAATAALGAAALAAAAALRPAWLRWVVGALVAFEAVSIAVLVLSRTGSVLGWTEPVWTPAAEQTLAIEIGAMVALAAVVAVDVGLRRSAQSDYPRGVALGNA